MTLRKSVLAVLIDSDDLGQVFTDWPDQICLATCLFRDGNCHIVYFRRDERPDIAHRVLDTLRVEENSVCFVPEVPGYATHDLLYSDERRLMALISSDVSILDGAVDYSVNYTYALEEGLDPVTLLGLPPRRGVPIQLSSTNRVNLKSEDFKSPQRDANNSRTPRELSPLLPEFLRKAAEQSRRPRFSSVRTPRSNMGPLVSEMLPQQ